MAKIDPKLQSLIDKVTGKRPRTVIDHILEHGFITNEELKDKYGYNHPPRAIRDVRENGVPIVTERVKDSTGRSIARYKFGDPSEIENHKLGGRVTFSKELSEALYEQQGGRCALSGVAFERRYLQVDHRIPYEVAGENGRVADESDPDAFMLVSGAANRQKSWTCEHCPTGSARRRLRCASGATGRRRRTTTTRRCANCGRLAREQVQQIVRLVRLVESVADNVVERPAVRVLLVPQRFVSVAEPMRIVEDGPPEPHQRPVNVVDGEPLGPPGGSDRDRYRTRPRKGLIEGAEPRRHPREHGGRNLPLASLVGEWVGYATVQDSSDSS